MRARGPTARSIAPLLFACCVLLDRLPPGRGLRCLSCRGCAKFEHSQAVQCAPTYDKCLKLHVPSGLVNRECGDETTCREKSKDRERHSAVHCCETDVCNGAPGRTVFTPLTGSLLAAAASCSRLLVIAA